MNECLVCGHFLPLGVWNYARPDIGVCVTCRDLGAVNRGPCSDERGCACRDIVASEIAQRLSVGPVYGRDFAPVATPTTPPEDE